MNDSTGDHDSTPDDVTTQDEGTTEYLDLDDLIQLAEDLLGEPAPILDVGLLGAAAVRPSVRQAGRDIYPDVFTKAAALMDSLVRCRPLESGNARFGWFATAVFLEINGVSIPPMDVDAVTELVAVARNGDIAHGKNMAWLAERLRALIEG